MAHPGEHAAQRPDDPAVIMAGDGRRLTWRELDRTAVAVANAWYEQGLRPEDPVAWCLENRPEFIVLIWAAQYSGLRYTPLSTRLARDEAAYIIENCGARILMVSGQTRPILGAALDERGAPRSIDIDDEWPGLTATAGEPARFELIEGVSMLFSSGTTGRPKVSHMKCPRSVDFEPSLPRQPNGKLYKRVLQDRYRSADPRKA